MSLSRDRDRRGTAERTRTGIGPGIGTGPRIHTPASIPVLKHSRPSPMSSDPGQLTRDGFGIVAVTLGAWARYVVEIGQARLVKCARGVKARIWKYAPVAQYTTHRRSLFLADGRSEAKVD
ncbi:unnamed protein product [Mycena citricolor]|uniref:Uncharacterized protein n=1 Tax=Mycena citricolor TaxID=2018698 RepID=A0AAD2GTT1_9AGAR|nr:unnamed protein product [Mycena citricolor]